MRDVRAATRREFLQNGVGLVGVAATVPTFLSHSMLGMMQHAMATEAGGKDGKLLVVIQLAGGNDGLNTVIPYAQDEYYKLRPRIAIPKQDVLTLNDMYGLHPQATGFRNLWNQGQLAIVHGVGYPNPDRSHFVGTRIWHSASPDGAQADGWLGRYFDHECGGADPDPRAGIAIDSEMPLAMRGSKFMPLCMDGQRLLGNKKGGSPDGMEVSPRATGGASDLDFLRRSVLDAEVHAEQIRKAARKEIEGVSFPNNRFANDLETIAKLIAAGLPTKVYYASFPGFDTHAQQMNRHGNLLRDTGNSLDAFMQALKRTGNLERTTVLVFSEFGRRASENASSGTDHGEAAPVFVLGGAVKGGFVGEMPSLGQLHRGDLAYNTDFRRIYATLLDEWLGADSTMLLGQTFDHVPLLTSQKMKNTNRPAGRRVPGKRVPGKRK